MSQVLVTGIHREEPDLRLLAEALLELARTLPPEKVEQLRKKTVRHE